MLLEIRSTPVDMRFRQVGVPINTSQGHDHICLGVPRAGLRVETKITKEFFQAKGVDGEGKKAGG